MKPWSGAPLEVKVWAPVPLQLPSIKFVGPGFELSGVRVQAICPSDVVTLIELDDPTPATLTAS